MITMTANKRETTMSSVAVDRWIATFYNFKARTAEEWGPDARMFVAIAKDGQGRSLPVNNIDAISREFSAALDEDWTPIGAFVLDKCDLGIEMGGVEMGIPAIHIDSSEEIMGKLGLG